MSTNASPVSWRRAAMCFLVAVIGVAAAILVLDGGRPAVAAGDCQYQPYGQYEPYGDPCPTATPTLSTAPQPAGGQLGMWVYDRATLAGGDNPTGTLSFSLYGPGDETCSAPVFVSQAFVYGNGDFYSGSSMVDRVGTWRWTVAYSGDDRNEPASSGCSEEPVTVTKATPTGYLYSTGSTAIGSTLYAYGYSYGGFQPTGSVTVSLYRPGDASCSGAPAATWSFPFGWSIWTTFTADEIGTWRYSLDYPGDANNTAFAWPCGTTSAEVVKATPSLWVGATPTAMTIGGEVAVNGQLGGGYRPTGSVSVEFFAPDDTGCSSPVETRDVSVDGGGGFSTSFAPSSVGLWRIGARYAGDDDNNAASTWCGAAAVDVSKASPSVVPAASPTTVQTGGRVQALALVRGGFDVRGRVAFRLYAPEDATCAGLPAYIEEAAVVDGAAETSSGYVVPREGAWRWQAVYLGDGANNGATSPCDRAPVSVVTKLPTPPGDPGGTPFSTNVYFDCVGDRTIQVPYGDRLVLRLGFQTATERQIKGFLTGTRTRASVDGVPVANADQHWGKPVSSSGSWLSRWSYDTGRVVTAYTQPFTVELEVVATKVVTDGIDTWRPGDVVVPGGLCLVTGVQPS